MQQRCLQCPCCLGPTETTDAKCCSTLTMCCVATIPAVSMLSPAVFSLGLPAGSCVASRNSCQAACPDTACERHAMLVSPLTDCWWPDCFAQIHYFAQIHLCHTPVTAAGTRPHAEQTARVSPSAPPLACGPCTPRKAACHEVNTSPLPKGRLAAMQRALCSRQEGLAVTSAALRHSCAPLGSAPAAQCCAGQRPARL